LHLGFAGKIFPIIPFTHPGINGFPMDNKNKSSCFSDEFVFFGIVELSAHHDNARFVYSLGY